MPKIDTVISKDLYAKIEEEVNLGLFPNISKAINETLRKAYAEKSRKYLRWFIKKEGISESSMLKELKNIRK